MTISDSWTPDLARFRGPRYRAIAEAISSDVAAGILKPGMQLPTHRDLAYRLGVTIGTVTRAYAEAERRGLIGGEVGRGTFVRRRAETSVAEIGGTPTGTIDFSMNIPTGGSEGTALARGLASLAASPRLASLATYQPHLGASAHRAAMSDFLALMGVELPAERLALTGGGQHGIFLALDAVARPGDVIAADALCYGGFKATARLLDLKIKGVASDTRGMRPDALDALCREGEIKAVYVVPNLQNPTGEVWDLERRQAIIEVCTRHDVAIIEDDVYGFLVPEAPPPLALLAPERTFYINSTSKSLASGLRIGVLAAPQPAASRTGPAGALGRIASGLRSTCWMAPPLMAELLSIWIEDGTATQLIEEKRRVGASRQAFARALLSEGGVSFLPGHPNAFHLWLPLDEPWRGEDLASAARAQGVLISAAANFSIGRPVTDGIRVCLGTPGTLEDVERGLSVLIDLIRSGADNLSEPL